MSNRIAVNQSRVKSWRQCHRQHWYRYVEKITKKVKRRPLVFGSLVHEMLEAYANADDPWETYQQKIGQQRKLFRAEREEYGDIALDIKFIMEGYFNYWPEKSITYLRVNKKAAEHVFEIQVGDGIYWKGKIDAFAKYKGLKGLVEHKTMSREWPEDERWRNVQSITYKRAADMMGWPSVDGTVWDYILSKPPSYPRVNNDGSLHKGKISTLPGVIDHFIRENPRVTVSKLELERLRESARACVPKYYQRHFTPAKREVEENIFSDFMETVVEIAETGDKKKARNIGRHCSWCEYEPICRAELQGLDVDYVREKEYKVDEEAIEKDLQPRDD